MAKLIATRSILFQNRLYAEEEQLPYYDKEIVDAWVDAGSAKWVEDSENQDAEDNLQPEPSAPESEENVAEDNPQPSSSTPEPEKDVEPVGRAVKKRAGKG